MLRIATTQIYQQAAKAMNERQVALNKVQQQMASGQRLLSNADDPVGSARLLNLNEELGRYGQYQRNIDLASGRLNLEDSVLGDASELLQQTRELVVQANTDTLNDGDRKAIAKQVRQIQEQMVGLANTKDGNGEYLFAGFKSQTQPFVMEASKQTTFHGDQGQRSIKAGPSLDIPVGDSGSAAFQADAADPAKGVFATLDRLAVALEGPSPQFHDAMGTGLTELDQGLENLAGVRAQVGARLNALEAQESANGDFSVHLQETINSIDSLDYAEAATRLSQEAFTLQAAQQSFVKIQNLSLFNYMR